LTDTSLFIYICVKRFGFANIKIKHIYAFYFVLPLLFFVLVSVVRCCSVTLWIIIWCKGCCKL